MNLQRLTIAVLMIGLSTARAAEVLELKDVLRRGLEFSPEIKKSTAAMREATYSTRQREAGLLPTIDATATAMAKKDATSLNALSGSVGLSAHNEDYNVNLKMSQPLYVGGAISNGLSTLKLAEEVARQKMFSARQNAIQALVLGYFNLAKAEKNLAAADEQKTMLKGYADITSSYEKIGRSRRTDRLMATVNLALAEADLDRLAKDLAAASDGLKRLMGASEGGDVLSANSSMVIAPVDQLTLEKALQAASENNPELKASELLAQKQRYENEVDLAPDFPSLSLDGTLGYKAPDRPTWFDEPSRFYTIGLTLKVPLFSGLSSFAKRKVHSERNYGVDRDLEIKRLDIKQKIMAALQAIRAEFSRLHVAQTAVAQGREALTLANQGYRQGISSSQDVLNAQNTRFKSESLLIETQFAYLQALLELRLLMGVDLEKAYVQ